MAGEIEGFSGVDRPFVLTRSFFLGSQKFGAFWTGDNQMGFEEFQGTVSALLSAGVSGLSFGGADVPGFSGNASEHDFILGYQLGALMPFFRAHSHENFQDREPWKQSERV